MPAPTYLPREGRGVKQWIRYQDYGQGKPFRCELKWVYRGFVGCPAWSENREPCRYPGRNCFLDEAFRWNTSLRAGAAWGRPLADCEDCHRQEDDGSCRAPECRVPIDVSPARAALRQWLDLQRGWIHTSGSSGRHKPTLNAGELADSCGWPRSENPHPHLLLSEFTRSGHPWDPEVLFVTKTGLAAFCHHLRGFASSDCRNVILSWSIGNAGEEYEPPAPDNFSPPQRVWGPSGRVAAAGAAIAAGYRVRIRFDPLLDEPSPMSIGSRRVVAPAGLFVRDVLTVLHSDSGGWPEVLTLGLPRLGGGRPGYSAEQRIRTFRFALTGIQAAKYPGKVGLCKETREVYDTLRRSFGELLPERLVCNCITPC